MNKTLEIEKQSSSLKPELREKIINVTSALFPDADIYIYGSRARGTNSETSDIDLALDSGKKLDRYAVSELKDVLLALNQPYDIDIVDLNNISKEFKKIITPELVLWKKNR